MFVISGIIADSINSHYNEGRGEKRSNTVCLTHPERNLQRERHTRTVRDTNTLAQTYREGDKERETGRERHTHI